jgi:hypothetical protein
MTTDDKSVQPPRCTTCHRKSEIRICPACHLRTANQLAEIPSILDRLAIEAVRGSASGSGEFVTGGAFGSRSPLRLDALTLTATTSAAIGLALAFPQPPEPDDAIPLWLVSWAAVWRQRLGHHQPPGVRVRRPPALVGPTFTPPDDPNARQAHPRAVLPDVTTLRQQHAAEVARQAAYRSRVHLGMDVAHERNKAVTGDGAWTAAEHDDDPVAAHWTARFGPPRQVRRIITDLAYLRTWWDDAAGFDDAADFVLGLRTLIAAGRAAIGERSDLVRLGRCPEVLLDRNTNEYEYCGANLARDPMVTVVICPRCRAETNERGLLNLAVRMRDVWGADDTAGRDAWTD